jgi:GNAT superfamily N-acetyltransferase
VRLEIGGFTTDDLDEAGALLADRHRLQRQAVPALDPAYEELPAARRAVEELLGQGVVAGATARRAGRLVGYLVGTRRDDAVWGPNVWVEASGWAVEQPETARDLYGRAAASWVAEGLTAHYAVVPATDPALVDAWFRIGFGLQHVQAIRAAPTERDAPAPPPGVTVRRAERGDLDVVARLDLVLPEHQALSPTFSALAIPTLEEARHEWEEDWGDSRFTVFVAEHEGRVIGSAIGSAVDVSSLHAGITRPPGAAFLAFAAVLPEARGLGAGRALGEAVLAWARSAGYDDVVTDWRSTNLLSSRAWSGLGFRPTFLRLHRVVGW